MRPLLLFLAVTFAVTWTFFLAAVALADRPPSDQALAVSRVLVFIGAMAPGLAALVISAYVGGILGMKALLDRLFLWQTGVRWYLFAAGYLIAIKLAVAPTHRMVTGSWPRLGQQTVGAVIAAIIISTPFQSGEEIGWRGYALPQLAERLGFAWGSALLRLIWACWHLPLFFLRIPGNDEYGQSFPVWAAGVIALSIAIAWLYSQTNGSLLLTMLMHSAVNNGPHFVPSPVANTENIFSPRGSPVVWLTAAFLWVGATYFLLRMRPGRSCADTGPLRRVTTAR